MACGGTAGLQELKNCTKIDDSNYEPLDMLMIEYTNQNGSQKVVSALNIGFMEPREYVYYKPLPSLTIPDIKLCKNYDRADEEEWLERLSFLEEDLHWLLKLPYHRFWSQVVYDEDLQQCLQSYLSQAPREYDLCSDVREELLAALQRVHKLVFLTFLRMSTYKESKAHHITPKAFGDIIYEHYVFDIPKMMDLCILYSNRNPTLLTKMIENIFSTQPQYLEDLDEAACTMLTVFDLVEEKLNVSEMLAANPLNPVKLDTQSPLKSFNISSLLDIISYITDTAATVNSFLEIYPHACSAFYRSSAVYRIASFYENVFPLLQNEIKNRMTCEEFRKTIEYIKRKVILSKAFFIKIFHNIISFCCISPMLDIRCNGNKNINGESLTHCEEFLQIFTEVVAEKSFIQDYNKLFPFDDDLEVFNEVGVNLDPTRLNYIFSSIHNLTDSKNTSENPKPSHNKATAEAEKLKTLPSVSVKNLHSVAAVLASGNLQQKTEIAETSVNEEAAAAAQVNGIELESLTQAVLDVLPGYGSGFIEACLEYYGYSSEKVIDALLQSNLPEHLNKLDRNLKRKKDISNNSKSDVEQYSLLNERKSIFDYDEFDLFNRQDVDMDRIHVGKSNKTPTTYNTLKDEKDSTFLKELILKYGDNDDTYNEELGIYEDEYDDTYDSTPVAIGEPQPESELPTVKVRQSNNKKEVEIAPSDDEDSEENVEDTNNTAANAMKPGDFCINPEIARQKREEWLQSKFKNKGNRKSGNTENQNKSTEHQRKERHKGQAANHNRRKQSDFKKSRGMVPFPTR